MRQTAWLTGILLMLCAVQPAHAQVFGAYDGRDDVRDFPTNGVFPGDFAPDPGAAWIGAAGLLAGKPFPDDAAYGHPRPPYLYDNSAGRIRPITCVGVPKRFRHERWRLDTFTYESGLRRCR
jgi:hypothetical protein